jgi:hypothetical protein
MGSSWRDGFEFAYMQPDSEPGEGPGLPWRQLTAHHWSWSWNGKLHGTITLDSEGWLAHVRPEDPPRLSPITTIGRFATVEEAQVATDEGWASR